mgnify:CR=1 FL=1
MDRFNAIRWLCSYDMLLDHVMSNKIKVDSLVRKLHPSDGSIMARKPIGDILRVMKIVDHKPIDGAVQSNCIAILADDSWVFKWNLALIQE